MTTVTQSTYTTGPTQADGRAYVTESHLLSDGRVVQFEYLADEGVDPAAVLHARSQRVESEVQANEAALNEASNGRTPLTKYQFRQRFTYPERIAIDGFHDTYQESGSLTEQQKAAIRTNLEDYRVSGAVYLDNPATIAGVQMYEALGLIAQGRSAEILGIA